MRYRYFLTNNSLVRASVVAVGIICYSAAGHGQQLNDELAQLVDSHPRLGAASKMVDASDEAVRQAKAGFFPRVTLSAEVGPERIDSQSRSREWRKPRKTASLTVDVPLFDLARYAALRGAGVKEKIASVRLNDTRQEILWEGVRAYVGVLRQKRLLELARQNAENIRQQMNLESERVERGSGISQNVLFAKSRLQIARERLVNFEGALVTAMARYAAVFDHEPDLSGMTDPLPPENIPEALEAFVSIALEDNPVVTNSALRVREALEERAAAQAGYWPKLNLVGRANYENDKNGVDGIRRDQSLILEASWDIFSGFLTQASVARASAVHSASQYNRRDVMRSVVRLAKSEWQALKTARGRLALLDNAVVIAQEVWELRKKSRESGSDTVINVLDAENEIYNAQINRAAAHYDAIEAIYRLMRTMGALELANL